MEFAVRQELKSAAGNPGRADRQTDRQTDIQTDRRVRQTDRQTDRRVRVRQAGWKRVW